WTRRNAQKSPARSRKQQINSKEIFMNLTQEIEKRKTFAIISHPDAGKTTLTEKLLLFGGAIREAGTVKGKKSNKFATSDWMKVEQERGISVTSSVMQFDFDGYKINILDTPGHEDFSEDTYRTLRSDAGKTTLTEKLLLFGGAIREAGTVKGKKSNKFATSDWMKVEQERGISVTSSVMQFDFDGYKINILDTPGHEDFSEDTYRTL